MKNRLVLKPKITWERTEAYWKENVLKPITERKKNLKISKISYYSIQDILYLLGVTDKWKYLEELEYEKERRSNSL